ncbi:MAG: PEP-CTERM sorting domain-containing protein [Phycisphaerae bacterium]|nr:PEP-CTERM sorting domain-containing protein [Phycisphaerae bacterium]
MAHSHSFTWILVSLLLLALAAPLQADITPSGDVNPTEHSWWASGGSSSTNAYIGYYSTTIPGSVIVNDGNDLSARSGLIGFNSGSTGVVTVDGSGSTWACSGSSYYGGLLVGSSGHGTLNITNGGAVNATYDTWVAKYDGAVGEIHFDVGTLTTGSLFAGATQLTGTGTINTHGLVSDVDILFNLPHGSNQTLTLNESGQNITINLAQDDTGYLGAGYIGNGTISICDGISVESNDGYIGYKAGSVGEVTVDGSDSTWTCSSSLYSYLYVGHKGQGTLDITNGGTVRNYYGYIGNDPGSTGAVTVDGSGSTWSNYHDLHVGYSGYGTLNITNGGNVSDMDGTVSAGGVVTVDGSSSTWTNSDDLYIGHSGEGTLNITDGGVVSNVHGYIGRGQYGDGLVTVDGNGSTWTNNGGLYIGDESHGMLNITNGGAVSSSGGYIGNWSGSTGVVTVDGSGSTWTNSFHLYVGCNRSHGTLNITDGGAVNVAYDTWVARLIPAVGEIRFDVGTLTTRSLCAGAIQLTGTGTINTHGLVSDVELLFDSTPTHGLNQTLTLDSEPDQNITINLDQNSTGCLGAGYVGEGTLEIRDGVSVESSSGYIGYKAGSVGVVTVDGSGSTWANVSDFPYHTGNIFVGYYGHGALNITDGGAVSNTTVHICCEAGSTAEVMVDGIGSTWTCDGYLDVGEKGHGTLNITNGGVVISSKGYIGKFSGEVTVDGSGSRWTNNGELRVGDGAGHGTLDITDGGVISNTDGYIGYSYGTGVVAVDGSGSTWTNSNKLTVGCYGGNGTLNITDGGTVSNSSGCIGYDTYSSTDGEVMVDGSGSRWTNSDDLYIGGRESYSGGTGKLTVINGGSVEVGDMLKIWGPGTLNIGATGQVFVGEALVLIDGGTLIVEAGGIIHMTGSAFRNESANSANLTGLGNLTLIFEGGSEDIDPFEVAGEDVGPVMEGFESNFALGTLQLGGDDIGYVQLVDDYDNSPDWTDSEVLYIETLIVGADSTLDLNGLNLYYVNGTIDGSIIDSAGGGSAQQIPEPASAVLLLSGGVLAMFRRRRK